MDVKYDSKSHQLVLEDGTPLDNIKLTSLDINYNTTPFQEFGSDKTMYLPGPSRITMEVVMEPEEFMDGIVKDPEEAERMAAEIVAEFKKPRV